MEISVTPYNKRDIAGFANIVFDGRYAVENVQIKRNKDNNLYVAFPSVHKKNGEIKEIFYPMNLEIRTKMSGQIIEAYNNALQGQRKTEIIDSQPQVSVKSVRTAKFEKDNLIGLSNVVLSNGCIVEGIQIKSGKNGDYISMPQYKQVVKENGNPVFENGLPKVNYRAMFKPITKESAAELKQTVINNFQKKYVRNTVGEEYSPYGKGTPKM